MQINHESLHFFTSGAREGQVRGADWSRFDLKRGIWTKPSHHTKEKRIEHVPLSESALALLRAMKLKNETGPLLPGGNVSAPRATVRRSRVQACKVAGLVTVETRKGKRHKILYKYRPTLRIHDLRHTCASHLVSRGTSLELVGKLLGHTRPETTFRYAHVADEAQRSATNKFGEMLQSPKKIT